MKSNAYRQGGRVIIIVGPSGVGKSTLLKRVMEKDDCLRFNTSHTTRSPRPKEVDGRDYHFISDEAFDAMIGEGEFAEWANVHTSRYGTSFSELKRHTSQGMDVILDVDVQGAKNLKHSLPDVTTIFILPPNLAVLTARLTQRATETAEQLATRLANAKHEIHYAPECDYVIINDDLEKACRAFSCIVTAIRHSPTRSMNDVTDFIDQFKG